LLILPKPPVKLLATCPAKFLNPFLVCAGRYSRT
jgi:hypothetical protein